MIVTVEDFEDEMRILRWALKQSWTEETKHPSTTSDIPSAGQCVVTAVFIYFAFGGELVSAIVNGESHWFNRFYIGADEYDVDLTGDQFGFKPIQIKEAGLLYGNSRVRRIGEVNMETLLRAYKFLLGMYKNSRGTILSVLNL